MPDLTIPVAATVNTGLSTESVTFTAPFRIDVVTSSDGSWLTFQDTGTSLDSFVVHGGNIINGSIRVDTDQLAAGNHTGTLTFSGSNNTDGSNMPYTIEVQATIAAASSVGTPLTLAACGVHHDGAWTAESSHFYTFTLAQQSSIRFDHSHDDPDNIDTHLIVRQGHSETGTIIKQHRQTAGNFPPISIVSPDGPPTTTLAAGDYTVEVANYDNLGDPATTTRNHKLGITNIDYDTDRVQIISDTFFNGQDGANPGFKSEGASKYSPTLNNPVFYVTFRLLESMEVLIKGFYLAANTDGYISLFGGCNIDGTAPEIEGHAFVGNSNDAIHRTLAAGVYTVEFSAQNVASAVIHIWDRPHWLTVYSTTSTQDSFYNTTWPY